MNSRLVVTLLLSLYHRAGQPTHLAATNLVVDRKGDTAAAVNPFHILFVLGKDSHTDNESGQTINGKLPTMDVDKDAEWVQAGRRMKGWWWTWWGFMMKRRSWPTSCASL